jgi:putative oxidoreductase
LYAGDAALVLLAITVSALIGTKIPILLGRPLGPFAPAKLDNYGWLSFFDAARADLCLAFSLLAILIDSGIRLGRRRHWYQGD